MGVFCAGSPDTQWMVIHKMTFIGDSGNTVHQFGRRVEAVRYWWCYSGLPASGCVHTLSEVTREQLCLLIFGVLWLFPAFFLTLSCLYSPGASTTSWSDLNKDGHPDCEYIFDVLLLHLSPVSYSHSVFTSPCEEHNTAED